MQNKTSKSKQKYADNSIETLRDMGREVLSDLTVNSAGAMWEQVSGSYSEEVATKGDLTEGQELDLSGGQKSNSENKNKFAHIEAGIDYRREILQGSERIIKAQNQEYSAQIQEIIGELKRLVSSSKELENQFKDVTMVNVTAVKAGKYQMNFFKWVLVTVRQARIKVEDSGAWLAMFKKKKGQKQYWAMFKKHGTSFAMSNERMLATQTG